MTKEKVIDVWISNQFLNGSGSLVVDIAKRSSSDGDKYERYTKATLVIEPPEKTAMITESEFNNMFQIPWECDKPGSRECYTDKVNCWREKIFGDKE